MSFNWRDFLEFAESLNANPNTPGPSEAALRSATSRAYYAAFHHAMEFAQNEGYQRLFNAKDHWDIRTHFREFDSPNQIRRSISVQLGRLYVQRTQADYDVELRSQPTSLATNAIGIANQIMQCVESLRTT